MTAIDTWHSHSKPIPLLAPAPLGYMHNGDADVDNDFLNTKKILKYSFQNLL